MTEAKPLIAGILAGEEICGVLAQAWMLRWCTGVPDVLGSDCTSRMVKDSWRPQPLRSGVTLLQVSDTGAAQPPRVPIKRQHLHFAHSRVLACRTREQLLSDNSRFFSKRAG